MQNSGIIYVLTNPAMPGIVKIGKTNQETVEFRMAQLYNTSVPVPFECAYAAKVDSIDDVEKALHTAFSPSRINSKREFFTIEPEQAIVIIRLLERQNITNTVVQKSDADVDLESKESSMKLKRRRPNLNFIEMGIPIGSVLQWFDSDLKVTVVGERVVSYQNDETSLTKLTRELLNLEYSVAPSRYWTFNGKSLQDIYNATYSME